MTEAIEKASKLSFYFAHSIFFYINSLEKIIKEDEIQEFRKVTDFKTKFIEEMNKSYEGQMLNSVEHFLGEKVKTVATKSDIAYLIKMYGYKDVSGLADVKVTPEDITLPNYTSIFKGVEEEDTFSFQSTLTFFSDLFIASEELKTVDNKKEKLKEMLQEVNLKLPACVYIPFVKDSDQYCNILNILVD